jgi:CRISPR-associated endonuclease/helicase Cas3
MVHADPFIDTELTARLIGTSHGHGRYGFPHVAAELAATGEHEDWLVLARDLFDEGGWDELIEQTHTRYGVWGCAYFEAVLRAADCQVSAEGKLCT